MKKYLLVLFLIVFIVPSVALASWWNPLSWFNNWNFHKTEVIKTETPTVNTDAEIKAKVDEQVKETLKVKADEEAKIAQQKIDEQKRIDTAVKNALDKQKVQTTTQAVVPAPQVVTPIPQNTTNSTEKNYFLETKSRVKELLDIQQSFEVWLQDTSDQFRSASLTLAGYSTGGLSGELRDASITFANTSIEVNSKMIVSTKKWISYYETVLETMNNNPNGFLDSSILNKLQTPESSEAEIEKIKTDISSSLDSVMGALTSLKNQANIANSQVSDKQAKLNEVNQKIADLNTKYTQDMNAIDVGNAGKGVTASFANAQKLKIDNQYRSDYNALMAEFQQIQYSN